VASTQVRQSMWTGCPKYTVRSKENGQLLLQLTGSTNGKRWSQKEAIRSLRFRGRESYTIICEWDPSQMGNFRTVRHMVEPVARLHEPLPSGDYTLVVTPRSTCLLLGDLFGDGGMTSGLDVVAHVETGDMSVEGDRGEFLQWHAERTLNSVWWSCGEVPLGEILESVTEVLGQPDDEVKGAIRLFDSEDGPEELPAPKVLEIARRNSKNVDFIVLDYDNFSFVWMNPDSPGRERRNTRFGEVSVVFEGGGNDAALIQTVEKTATPEIGKHAVSIVNRFLSKKS
jgi:ribosomal protein L30/L7E